MNWIKVEQQPPKKFTWYLIGWVDQFESFTYYVAMFHNDGWRGRSGEFYANPEYYCEVIDPRD